MTTHFKVVADFGGKKPEARAYFVRNLQTARSDALHDGARQIFSIKEVEYTWLTREHIDKDYALMLMRAVKFQVDAGVPAAKAVLTAIESEPNASKRARLQGTLDAIHRGANMADALYASGLFDHTVYSVLSAGERMGSMMAISSALEHMESRAMAWKGYMIALSMIFMELSTALTVPPSIHYTAIPYIRDNLPKASPEKLAAYLVELDVVEFRNLVWMDISVLGLVVCMAMGFAWFTNDKAKQMIAYKVLMKLPLLREWYVNDALIRGCKMFATMLKSGVRMNDAIDTIAKSTTNPVALKFWSKSKAALNTGVLPGLAFATTGILRRDEVLVLNSARGNEQISKAFSAMSQEREWRQKKLMSRIFKSSIWLTVGYIAITMVIGFKLFGLFNAGLEMSMNSMSSGGM